MLFSARLHTFLLALSYVDSAGAFCPDGMSLPDFNTAHAVEVIVAQAPLFSLNPAVGQKLSMINLFHTSLVFAQGSGFSRKYWTMEFGFTKDSDFEVMAPQVVPNSSAVDGTSLVWDQDSKYCLTPGLLHGRKHWTTKLEVVTTISVDQVVSAFDNFVKPLNSTQHGDKPQYHNFRVAKAGFWDGDITNTFIKDLTCNHGVQWFIHHIVTALGANIPPNFKLKGTIAVVSVNNVTLVDTTNAREWRRVVNFYRRFRELINSNKSKERKILDLALLAFERKYAYDPNAGLYYELIGNYAPFMRFEYATFPLTGPPFSLEETQLKGAVTMV